MNVRSSHERPGRKAASISIIVPVALCAFAITLTSTAQQAAAPAPPAVEAPSNFKFVARQPPQIIPGHAYAFDLCHGTSVNLPEGNKTNWETFAKDNAQGECNGPFDKQPTTVSGTDAPVQFGLTSGGGFQPIGMWLGANGLLYGTPHGHSVFAPKPFTVCATTTGGHSSCQEIKLAADAAANKASHAKVIGAVAAGGAAAAVVGAVAMRSKSSSSGGSCGTPPANLFSDCSSTPQSPNCPADLQAQDAYCKCEGYSGFNAGVGSCQ
jgi:hypothetical protein